MKRSHFPQKTLALVALMALALAGPAGAFVPAPPAATQEVPQGTPLAWQIEAVDAPKYYDDMGPRSLALDSDGEPRIAYGGDSLYYAALDGGTWSFQRVDSAPGVGQYASIAVSSSDRPAIAYFDAENGDLKYAGRWCLINPPICVWAPETVDSGGTVGLYASLALDAANDPHISYYDQSNAALKYAYRDGSGWHTLTVDDPAGADVGKHSAIALDAAGRPYISYYDGTNDDLKLAHWNGITWDLTVVDSAGTVGLYSSVAFAGSTVHISYYDQTNYTLKHAACAGSCTTETVTTGQPGADYTSIALDGSGRPHIAYRVWPADLAYAYFDGTNWITTTVETTGDVGTHCSLALDSAGHAHISHVDEQSDYLRYTHYDGATWQGQDLDEPFGDVGRYSSLALDAAGRPRISYHDSERTELEYAYLGSSGWHTELAATNHGSWTSLALDADGHPHISYYESGGLRYAHYDGTAWQLAAVDESGSGLGSGIALDAAGRPHISYHAGDSEDLRYAYFDGAAWINETVDAAGDVGRFSSLALDSDGHPHISYYDESNGCLKYATNEGTGWQIGTVDDGEGTHDVGQYSDIALNPVFGLPGISYFDETTRDLKFAWLFCPVGCMWMIETVDTAGDAGYYTSLAYDRGGGRHISYAEGMAVDLRYAYYDGATWHLETVDSEGDVGIGTSIAIDGLGLPHISYYDATLLDLKHAYILPYRAFLPLACRP